MPRIRNTVIKLTPTPCVLACLVEGQALINTHTLTHSPRLSISASVSFFLSVSLSISVSVSLPNSKSLPKVMVVISIKAMRQGEIRGRTDWEWGEDKL